jgi:hypothetical protein
MGPQSSNTPTNLTLNSFARKGFAFLGWNTASDGSGTAYANGAPYAFDANIRLFAQWGKRPAIVTGLRVTQAALAEVSASWSPIPGPAASYEVSLLDRDDVRVGACSTQATSCTIDSVPVGRYSVTVTARVGGVTGKPALSTVTVISVAPTLRDWWRGTGSDAKRAYATVSVPRGADPSRVMVWTRAVRGGSTSWTSQPAVRDSWTCRYHPAGTVCMWKAVLPTRTKVKFSANGLFTEVVTIPRPKRS